MEVTYWQIYIGSSKLRAFYRIAKATNKEGKRLRRKWFAYKYGGVDHPYMEQNARHYFSTREKAARWVVMDA